MVTDFQPAVTMPQYRAIYRLHYHTIFPLSVRSNLRGLIKADAQPNTLDEIVTKRVHVEDKPHLKGVSRWCDIQCLVVGDVDVCWCGQDLTGKRSLESHVAFIISHRPRPQRQPVGYILFVSGMDPEREALGDFLSQALW